MRLLQTLIGFFQTATSYRVPDVNAVSFQADRYAVPSPTRATSYTPFEQVLCNKYDAYQQQPSKLDTLVVTVIPRSSADHVARNPITGMSMRASYQDLQMRREDAIGYCARLPKNREQLARGGREEYLAMIIALDGPPIETQIPGWKPGTMHIPDLFLRNPLITIAMGDGFNDFDVNGSIALPGMARTPKESIPPYIRAIIDGGPRPR